MPPRLTCPGCDGTTTDLLTGRELRIAAVQWETGDPTPTREPIPEEC